MEQAELYRYRLSQLEQAIDGLAAALQLPMEEFNPTLQDVVQCGHVQKFEYCIELLWKMIKLWLITQEVAEVYSPKEIIKSFYRTAQISDDLYQRLLKAVHHRNLYSHVYNLSFGFLCPFDRVKAPWR